jgi:aspartate-semialdehyde dehydrogenase
MLATCLKPLGDIAKISKVFVSTYQSVSGVGEEGLDELFEQTRSIYTNQSIIETKKVFTKQIAFNVIPHIGEFAENGNTQEEESLIFETKRILGLDGDIFATCVRVPIFIGHCLAVSVEFEDDVVEAEIREGFSFYENIKLVDYRANEGYVSPFETIAQDDIYVSRLRLNNPKTLSMWIVADNMKAGIVLNMLNIYEKLKFLV